jgi:hypothetical protein
LLIGFVRMLRFEWSVLERAMKKMFLSMQERGNDSLITIYDDRADLRPSRVGASLREEGRSSLFGIRECVISTRQLPGDNKVARAGRKRNSCGPGACRKEENGSERR